MITKHKLVFDPADAAESDNVGAYIRSSNGTAITHTNVGGKDALDVNVANTVDISATNLDIRDLVFATDKVDVSGSSVELGATTLAALESITVVDGGGSLTVDAVNLDIRDLVFATDKVDVTGSAVSITGNVNVTQGTSPWVVSGTITATSNTEFAEDSAHSSGALGNYILGVRQDADTSPVSADGDYHGLIFDNSGRLKVAADISLVNGFEKAEDAAHASGDIGGYMLSVRQDVLASSTSASGDYQSFKTDALGRLYGNDANQTMENAAVTVGVTAVDLAGTDLANRKRILIQNRGAKAIFVGKDNTVTIANGVEIPSGASIELDIGPSVNVHAISGTAGQNVRVMELA